jgi:hypothetical protein
MRPFANGRRGIGGAVVAALLITLGLGLAAGPAVAAKSLAALAKQALKRRDSAADTVEKYIAQPDIPKALQGRGPVLFGTRTVAQPGRASREERLVLTEHGPRLRFEDKRDGMSIPIDSPVSKTDLRAVITYGPEMLAPDGSPMTRKTIIKALREALQSAAAPSK